MKIVINTSFGGFGLSDDAFELYLKKKKQEFYAYKDRFGHTDYYVVPKEKYDLFKDKWHKEDGDYRRINEKNWFLSYYDIERDDPILIEVIEEMGENANGRCADLRIVEIPDGIEWEIDEYDGKETIDEKHRSWR